MPVDYHAMNALKWNKHRLTRQQYRTIKGQILAGDAEGAMKGLKKLLEARQSPGKPEPVVQL